MKAGPETDPARESLREEADRFFRDVDHARAAARSRVRAELGLRLLERASHPRGRILEVGCGAGWAMERFRAAGFEVQGVDASPAAVEMARARGFLAEVSDIEAGVLPSGFTVVAALEVLEHLRDPRVAL